MDGDGYGDSQAPGANNSDDCPEEWGNSTMKSRFGCLDTDGDGYHDYLGDDKFPADGTQWEDRDLDSWGDNPDGNDADQCLNTSTAGDRTEQARINFGCADYQSDSDNDGVTDDADACPGTVAGAEVYPSGCKKETQAEPEPEGDWLEFELELEFVTSTRSRCRRKIQARHPYAASASAGPSSVRPRIASSSSTRRMSEDEPALAVP